MVQDRLAVAVARVYVRAPRQAALEAGEEGQPGEDSRVPVQAAGRVGEPAVMIGGHRVGSRP